MKLHEQIEIHLLLQSRSSVYLRPLLLPGPSSRPPVASIRTYPDFQRLQQAFAASCSSLLQPASAWGYYPRLASWACESQLHDLRALLPAKIPLLFQPYSAMCRGSKDKFYVDVIQSTVTPGDVFSFFLWWSVRRANSRRGLQQHRAGPERRPLRQVSIHVRRCNALQRHTFSTGRCASSFVDSMTLSAEVSTSSTVPLKKVEQDIITIDLNSEVFIFINYCRGKRERRDQ